MNCERHAIPCPGYQDPFDLKLRQAGTWQVASDGANFDPSQQEELQHQVIAHGATRTIARPQLPQTPKLRTALDEAALGAFYASYCVASKTIRSLDFLRQEGNGCLWESIKILGMLQLHQVRQLPQGVDQVLKQYTDATSRLNLALAHPTESRRDSTLLATLILSIAEMKQSSEFTLHYWQAHTTGASALISLRGPEQIFSRTGSALFLQLSSQIVIECLLGHRRIPEALLDLRERIEPLVLVKDNPLWQWHGVTYRFANFWSTACTATESYETLSNTECQAMIAEAENIYQGIESVFQSAGTLWQFSIQPSGIFMPFVDYEHVYSSLLTARLWSDRRTAPILLLTAVARLHVKCPGLASSAADAVELNNWFVIMDVINAIRNTAKDILAAIPQVFYGLLEKIKKPKAADTSASTTARASQTSQPAPSSLFQSSWNPSQVNIDHSTITQQGLRLCDSATEYDEQVFYLHEQYSPSFTSNQITNSSSTVLPYLDACRLQWPLYFAVQCEFLEPSMRLKLLDVLEISGRSLGMVGWMVLAKQVRMSGILNRS